MSHEIPALNLTDSAEGSAPDLVLTAPTSDKPSSKAPSKAPKGEKKVAAKAPKKAEDKVEPKLESEDALRAEIDALSAQIAEKTPEVEKAANASKEAKKELQKATKATAQANANLKKATDENRAELQKLAEDAATALAAARESDNAAILAHTEVKLEAKQLGDKLKTVQNLLENFGKITEKQRKAQEAADAKKKAQDELEATQQAEKDRDTAERLEARNLAGHYGPQEKFAALTAALIAFADRPEKSAAGRKHSKVDGPVARCRAICESMPDARRKDQVAACVAEGISEGTAKSQVQTWRAER